MTTGMMTRAKSITITTEDGRLIVMTDVQKFDIELMCGTRETTFDGAITGGASVPAYRTYKLDPTHNWWRLSAQGWGHPTELEGDHETT